LQPGFFLGEGPVNYDSTTLILVGFASDLVVSGEVLIDDRPRPILLERRLGRSSSEIGRQLPKKSLISNENWAAPKGQPKETPLNPSDEDRFNRRIR
jgi:hypothetical protein